MPPAFVALSSSKALNNPGIVIMDPTSGEFLFSKNPSVTKAPASVMKLFSTTDALISLGAEKRFETSIYKTSKRNKFVLIGAADPWLTTNSDDAKKYERAYLPYLLNKALQESPRVRAISLSYKNLYAQDLVMIRNYFKGRVKIYPHQIKSEQELQSQSTTLLATVTSPPLSQIVQFTLLWSDNLLAARLEQLAARSKGLSADSEGIQKSITSMLESMDIPTSGLIFKDGAGLSHDNRVTVSTVAKLLKVIHTDAKYEAIYRGLPVAGESGTLKNRFVKDAPSAVGLIHAKTGWINTSVSLAGFVQTSEKQYIFAIIASGLPSRESVRASARVAIDKLLATIAKPPAGAPLVDTSTTTLPTDSETNNH